MDVLVFSRGGSCVPRRSASASGIWHKHRRSCTQAQSDDSKQIRAEKRIPRSHVGDAGAVGHQLKHVRCQTLNPGRWTVHSELPLTPRPTSTTTQIPLNLFGENLTPVQKAIPSFGSLCYFLYLQLIGAPDGGGQPRPRGVCFNLSANCTAKLFWDLVGIIEMDGTID